MEYHTDFGLVLPEHRWVPAPRYLLRRARVLEIFHGLPPGKLLEIGCGVGALLEDFRRMGHHCYAFEISERALQVARDVHAAHDSVHIYDRLQTNWNGQFDYLAAFEVLEHIEDDFGALQQWRQWLKPGGILVFSVPAHMNRWSSNDEWAGHYRRYEKQALIELVGKAGLGVEQFENYGVPLADIIDPIRSFLYGRRLRRGTDRMASRQEQNIASGVNRPVENGLWFLLDNAVGRSFMRASIELQKPFLKTDMGSNYLLVCRA